MAQQVALDADCRADTPNAYDHGNHEVAEDLAYKRLTLVNIVFVGRPNSPDWVLVDTGIPGHAAAIIKAAALRFGENVPPVAIVLTHGHNDHVANLEKLAQHWQVPVYAHELEHPYLDGTASYPPPDPGVGGGVMSLLSPIFPNSPVNVSRWLTPLSSNGTIAEMPGWRWIHTPGHTPGHVSFWRESDRTMIVGDAFLTTNQESAYSVMTQAPEMHGPPKYFTPDWGAARNSVRKLADLEPELVICGHGRAMRGQSMRNSLQALALNFDQVAVPKAGIYLDEPARAADGTAYIT